MLVLFQTMSFVNVDVLWLGFKNDEKKSFFLGCTVVHQNTQLASQYLHKLFVQSLIWPFRTSHFKFAALENWNFFEEILGKWGPNSTWHELWYVFKLAPPTAVIVYLLTPRPPLIGSFSIIPERRWPGSPSQRLTETFRDPNASNRESGVVMIVIFLRCKFDACIEPRAIPDTLYVQYVLPSHLVTSHYVPSPTTFVKQPAGIFRING